MASTAVKSNGQELSDALTGQARTELLTIAIKLEIAQAMGNHESGRTTGIDDWRYDRVSHDEAERILTWDGAKAMKCWICGEEANTGEHRTKASDLRSLFGTPTQAKPFYFHTAKRRNVKLATLRAPDLKFTARLCNRCNSARTQPHDFAWQHFSETLRMRKPPIAAGNVIRSNRIFPYDTRRAMLNLHLYFVKLFGCQIIEGKIPIDIAPFSNAILQERPHPNVYLAFGPTPTPVISPSAGGTDVVTAMLEDQCAFATWFYEVGNLSVNIMYAIEGEKRDGLINAWHPRFHHKRLVMVSFIPDEPRRT